MFLPHRDAATTSQMLQVWLKDGVDIRSAKDHMKEGWKAVVEKRSSDSLPSEVEPVHSWPDWAVALME